MGGHSKLVADILTSSVWQLDMATRIVWITLLALKDKDGFVSASLPGLAHTARVTREECEKAVQIFETPDPDSRTPDNDGRRIEHVEGGWVVLNHYLYRDRLSNDPETVQARVRMQRFRQRHPPSVTDRNVTLSPVTGCNAVSVSGSVSEQQDKEFDECWALYPDKTGKTKARAAYDKARREGTTQADVLAGINRYCAYVRQRQATDFKDLKFKNGATWFNQRCWEDECTVAKRNSAVKRVFDPVRKEYVLPTA